MVWLLPIPWSLNEFVIGLELCIRNCMHGAIPVRLKIIAFSTLKGVNLGTLIAVLCPASFWILILISCLSKISFDQRRFFQYFDDFYEFGSIDELEKNRNIEKFRSGSVRYSRKVLEFHCSWYVIKKFLLKNLKTFNKIRNHRWFFFLFIMT